MYSDMDLQNLARSSQNSKTIKKIVTTDSTWISRLDIYPSTWQNTRKLYHWFYLNGSATVPMCNECNLIEVRYVSYTAGYKNFCSTTCCNKSSIWKDSVKNSNIQKYGVSSVMKLESVKSRLSNTMIEKYGVDNFSKSSLFKEKFKETCLRKYGVNSPMQLSDVKEKIKKTYIEKYGVDSPNKITSVKEKKKQTWLKKYGYDNPSKVPAIAVTKISTMRLNGFIKSDEEKGEQRAYYDRVSEITKQNWIEHFYKINPRKLKRSFEDYHLDHIFSVIDGFQNGVPPEIIGHWTNLQLIPKMENIRKQRRSDKTLEQLLEDYQMATIGNSKIE